MAVTSDSGRTDLLRRAGAALLDLALAAILGGTASKLAILPLAAWGADDGLIELVRKLLLIAVYAGLCVLPVAGRRQSTLGQRWVGLQVLGASGRRPSLREAFGRWLAFIAAALPLGAGLLLGLGPERRPFQDRLCASRLAFREPRGGAA